jgi:hypothetical protein
MKNITLIVLLIILSLVNDSMGITTAAAAPPLKEGSFEGLTQNWDKVLTGSQRFIVLETFSNQAVRDNETGLVWERSPRAALSTWTAARGECANGIVGGRKGFRLPSIVELSSLVDVASAGLALPPGNPFNNVQSAHYWSATVDADPVNTNAWLVLFQTGFVLTSNKAGDQTGHVWCVRGPMNADAY